MKKLIIFRKTAWLRFCCLETAKSFKKKIFWAFLRIDL